MSNSDRISITFGNDRHLTYFMSREADHSWLVMYHPFVRSSTVLEVDATFLELLPPEAPPPEEGPRRQGASLDPRLKDMKDNKKNLFSTKVFASVDSKTGAIKYNIVPFEPQPVVGS